MMRLWTALQKNCQQNKLKKKQAFLVLKLESINKNYDTKSIFDFFKNYKEQEKL